MQPLYPQVKGRILWLRQRTPALGHRQFCAGLMGVLRALVGADVITWTECTSSWLRCRYTVIVMSANDWINAALADVDKGEVVIIPSLADRADWDSYETARRAMFGKFSSAVPTPRYNALS